MGEFFRGWRRKAGLGTLAMACVLALGWMRSYTVAGDAAWFGIGSQQQLMMSRAGRVTCESYPVSGEAVWMVRSYNKSGPLLSEMRLDLEERNLPGWVIPYWSLVLPLTLLSAWLILGKRPTSRATTNR